ncbi:unnamed protein product [Rhizophagus irregularis]|nr:unnamed protein product [Rhizophagus irregularis]
MSDKNNRIYINRLKVVIFSNFQPCGTLWEVWNRKRNWKGAYPWIQHGYERKLCNQRKTLLKILTSLQPIRLKVHLRRLIVKIS